MLHESVNLRQAETSAASDLLGGKKRLENPVDQVRWNAAARIVVRAAIAGVVRGEVARQEIHVNLPVGGWRWFDFQMRPVRDQQGAVVAIVPWRQRIRSLHSGRSEHGHGAGDYNFGDDAMLNVF